MAPRDLLSSLWPNPLRTRRAYPSVDCLRIESQFFEYRLDVNSNFRCLLRRYYLGNIVHLHRVADDLRQLSPGTLKRNNGAVFPQLRIRDGGAHMSGSRR